MKIYTTVCCLILVALLGCKTKNVHTTKMEGVDLSKYQTFAYLPNSTPEEAGNDFNDEDINVRIIDRINENLKNAGYELDRDEPDLLVLVSTRTSLDNETNASSAYARYPYKNTAGAIRPFYNPYYFRGYNTFSSVIGYESDLNQYQEGTLIIHLLDRVKEQIVWKGVASDNIYNQPSTQAIQELVDQIFSEFPIMR